MKAQAGDHGVQITRSSKCTDMHLQSIDESLIAKEVKESITFLAGCRKDIWIGETRMFFNGFQCPYGFGCRQHSPKN